MKYIFIIFIVILSFMVYNPFHNVGFITMDNQNQFQEQMELQTTNCKSNLVVDFLTLITPTANAQPNIEENNNNDIDLNAYGYYPQQINCKGGGHVKRCVELQSYFCDVSGQGSCRWSDTIIFD